MEQYNNQEHKPVQIFSLLIIMTHILELTDWKNEIEPPRSFVFKVITALPTQKRIKNWVKWGPPSPSCKIVPTTMHNKSGPHKSQSRNNSLDP